VTTPAAPTATADPNWPTAASWIASGAQARDAQDATIDLGIIGVPTCATSISPTRADTTPAAVRAALTKYAAFARGRDLTHLVAADFGDVAEPDGDQDAAVAAIASAFERVSLLVAIGGDNSLTNLVTRGASATSGFAKMGLITLDAHHDLRDGHNNGSPVRELIEAGLKPRHVVQIGIADFANSPNYAARARDFGITVLSRDDVERDGIDRCVHHALEIAAGAGGQIHVDLDVDVCDRSVAPACPASVPGGISAAEIRHAARSLAADARVRSIDIAEVDATRDTDDQRTVRLAALLVLEAAAGLASRSHGRD
jgi:formiminoglutamase